MATLAFAVSMVFVLYRESTFLLQTVFVYIIYSVIVGGTLLLAQNRSLPNGMSFALLAIDCLVVTAFVYLTGGITSPLYVFYLPIFGLTILRRSPSGFVYSTVLALLLYGGLSVVQLINNGLLWNQSIGHIVLLGSLVVVLYAVLDKVMREEKIRHKLVSRAKTMAEVSDILSGSLTNSRDWIKNISKIIDEEIHDDGLHCRIVIHRGHQQFLPPSGEKLGVHYPIMVGECVFGTLVVTREKETPLYHFDQDFFSGVARSFGLSLHRAKLWEDFQSRLENMEKVSPIDTMIEVVKGERRR